MATAPSPKPGRGYSAALGAPGPFAPMTPAQITNQIAGYTAGLPKPLTDQQIQLRAQGLLDPVVKSITDRETAAAKAAGGAITGYAGELANRLGAYGNSTRGIYSDAEGKQAAADAALSGAVSGGGSSLANALAAEFSKFGGDPATAGQVATTGAGAGNALLGTGTAALSNLIANEASSRDYGAKLPGLALKQGAADLRDSTMASQKTLADHVAQIEQGLPNIVEQLRSQSDTRATNRANVANQVRSQLLARNDSNAKFLRAEKDAGLTAETKAQAQVQAAKAKATASTKVAQIKAKEKAAADAKPNAALSKTVGYVVDSSGNWIPDKTGKPHMLPGYTTDGHGNVVKTPTAKQRAAAANPSEYPNLTKAQVLHLRAGIASAFNGVPEQKDVNGKVTRNALPAVSYQEAINHAVSAGYSRAAATRMANHFYMPGDRGRPGGKGRSDVKSDPVKTKVG